MEDPFIVMRRHCQKENIQPVDMLGWMLQILASSHSLNATFAGLGGSADSPNAIAQEIGGEMQKAKLLGAEPKVPGTVLELLDLMVVNQQRMEALNVMNQKRANGPATVIEQVDRQAKTLAALHMVLNDLRNQAEQQGLGGALHIEKQNREQRDF